MTYYSLSKPAFLLLYLNYGGGPAVVINKEYKASEGQMTGKTVKPEVEESDDYDKVS